MIKVLKESPEFFDSYRSQFEDDRSFLPLITKKEYYKSFQSFYSIRNDSTVVGFIFQYRPKPFEYLENAIVILPRYRERGYGYDAINATLSDINLCAGIYRVSGKNLPALGLFRKCKSLNEEKEGRFFLFYNIQSRGLSSRI